MEKIKNGLRRFRKSVAAKALAVSMALATTVVPALAVDGDATATLDTTAIKTSFTSGISSMATTTVDVLSAILPFALSIVSVYFVVKKGISWVKKI